MERRLVGPIPRAFGWPALIVGAVLNASLGAAAQPVDPSAPQDSHSIAEVQVTASKLDQRTLERVVTQFAKSHGAANAAVHQIGRWRVVVCPEVTGLRAAAGAFVSRRVTEVARSVGAPAPEAATSGKGCAVNVHIVFTPQPQQLLDHVAKAYPVLLGSSRSPGDALSRHAIQSWYVTGTKVDGWNPIATGKLAPMIEALQMGVDASTPGGAVASDGDDALGVFGDGARREQEGVRNEQAVGVHAGHVVALGDVDRRVERVRLAAVLLVDEDESAKPRRECTAHLVEGEDLRRVKVVVVLQVPANEMKMLEEDLDRLVLGAVVADDDFESRIVQP